NQHDFLAWLYAANHFGVVPVVQSENRHAWLDRRTAADEHHTAARVTVSDAAIARTPASHAAGTARPRRAAPHHRGASGRRTLAAGRALFACRALATGPLAARTFAGRRRCAVRPVLAGVYAVAGTAGRSGGTHGRAHLLL